MEKNTPLKPISIGDNLLSALLWFIAVAAWCGYGFDTKLSSTQIARMVMVVSLVVGGSWTLWRTWIRPTHETDLQKKLRLFLTFLGLSLLAAGLYWPERPFRMYVTPKIVFLYPLAIVLFGWWLWNMSNATVRRAFFHSPLTWLFAGMVVHLLINTAVSHMPAVTFWGSDNRQMGVVMVYACMASSLALALWVAQKKERGLFFLRGWLAVSMLMSLRAFYELNMPGVQSFRAFGFAGNPDYFGLQFHFTLLPALVLYFSERRKPWVFFYGAVLVLNIYAVAIIQTRGAFLGVGIASLVGMLVFSPERHLDRPALRRRLGWLVAILIVGFWLYYFYVGIVLPPEQELAKLPAARADALRDAANTVLARRAFTAIFVLCSISPFVLRAAWDAFPKRQHRWAMSGALLLVSVLIWLLPSLRTQVLHVANRAVRIQKILDPQEGEARFKVWKDTLPMVRDHFLLGVGRETYRVRFLPYKTFELATISPKVNYRSSHNIILDTLVMEGVIGLFLLVGLAVFGIGVPLRAASRQPQHPFAPVLIGLALAVVGYLVHELVIYDVIPTVFSFYTVLGLVAGFVLHFEIEKNTVSCRSWYCKWVIVSTVALTSLVSVYLVRQAYTDTLLTKLQQHAATLRRYQEVVETVLRQQRNFENLKREVHASWQTENPEKLRSLLARAGIDVRKMPTDFVLAKTWVQDVFQRIQNTIQEKEHQLDKNMGAQVQAAAVQVVGILRVMLAWNAVPENLYSATHAAAVLSYLPETYLTPMRRIDVLQLLVETSRRSVRNNTNPESAYSRLFSSEYTLARSLENAGHTEEAQVYFHESEKALQKSIDFDPLYYDTHRLKAVLLLERYCDAKSARGELEMVLRILKASRPFKELPKLIANIEEGPLVQVRSLEENPELLRACLARIKNH